MDTNDFVTGKQRKAVYGETYKLDVKKLDVQNNEQQAMLQRSYNGYKKAYDELMSSNHIIGSDSKTMFDVKAAFFRINDSLYAEVSDEKEKFDEELRRRKTLYEDAINCCDKYLEVHQGKRSIFGSGRYRKRLVTLMKQMAENDVYYLESRAKALWENTQNSNERPLWVNVLAEVRTPKIDLDQKNTKNGKKYEIDSVGQSGSSVFKIVDSNFKSKGEKKTFYIKKTGYNWSMEDEYNDVIKSRALIDEDQKQYTQEQLNIMKSLKKILEGKEKDWDQLYQMVCTYGESHEKEFDRLGMSKFLFEREIAKLVLNDIEKMCEGKTTEINLNEEINKDFILRYLTHMVIHYSTKSNCQRSKIKEGANLSIRNVATSRMAHLLGIDKLVAKSESVKYNYDGQDGKGILMEEAEGFTYKEITLKGKMYASGQTFLDLNTIQLFDIICGQTDRNVGNYMFKCQMENKTISSGDTIYEPKCIDNDLSFGELKYKDIAKENLVNNRKFEDDDGLCCLAYLDQNVINKIEELLRHQDIIRYVMADLLSKKEIECIIERMKGALKTINKTAKRKPNFLIDPNNLDLKDEMVVKSLQEQKGLNYRRIIIKS